MDKITHEVRLANWTKIIEQCNNRPTGTTAKQWLSDNGISKKSYYYWLRKIRQNAYANTRKEPPALNPLQAQHSTVTFAEIPLADQPSIMTDHFKADAVIHTGTLVIGISNTISDTLLSRLLEVNHHAR